VRLARRNVEFEVEAPLLQEGLKSLHNSELEVADPMQIEDNLIHYLQSTFLSAGRAGLAGAALIPRPRS
jgi:hypothetical protein